MKDKNEINDQIDKANEGVNEGSKFPGMSYEEGVVSALEWVMSNDNPAPMDD